jgi:hypothetical protein
MMRLVSIALVFATFVGVASADGPGAALTTNSLVASGGRMYTTSTRLNQTTLSLWHGTHKARRVVLDGVLGFPIPTFDGTGEGISHDGRTLLLVAGGRSEFDVVDARSLRVRHRVRLPGLFTYDALSPDARTLFLIQHVARTPIHYYVRAYDLWAGRLLEQVVFDRREGSVAMSGSPVTRATGPSGRWVYTLYVRPSGGMFVHALDTVDRHAFCVDLPKRIEPRSNLRLRLTPGRLAVTNATRPLAVIDTETLRVRT